MAEVSSSDAVRDRPPAVDPAPSPAYTFSSSLGLGTAKTLDADLAKARAARSKATEALAAQEELTASSLEKAAPEIQETAARTRKTEAAATGDVTQRRDALASLTPPSTVARPFLEPGASVLSQIQSLILGVGMMGLQIQGLAGGGGAAIAATAGLKGMLEGWQAGDAERVKRAYTEWHANHEKLLDEYEMARQSLHDVIASGDRSLHERLLDVSLRAEAAGHRSLAAKARADDAEGVLQDLYQMQQHYDTMLGMGLKLEEYRTTQSRLDRDYRATQAQRAITNERAQKALALNERRTNLAEGTNKNLLALQGQDLSLGQKLSAMDTVEDAVTVLRSHDMLGVGPSAPDQWKAWFNRQAAVGDPAVKKAVDIIERMGTPLVVGSEIAMGEPASTMRLKVMAEPQAGHLLTASPQFWDTFFQRNRPFLTQQRAIVQQHLKELGRLQPAAGPTGSLDDFEILDK